MDATGDPDRRALSLHFLRSANDYVFAMIFTTRNAKTAPVIIGEMLGTVEGVQWGVIFAAATVQLVPVLALVIALQRYLVAGLTAGAVKQ
jgi:multiple sugar transport system permease protein